MNTAVISLVISLCLCATARADITTGLAAYWPLDEGTGTVASDTIGGNTATLTNMETTDWTAAKVGSGTDHDGVNEYLLVADAAALEMGTGDMTIAFWCRPTDATLDQLLWIKGDPFGSATHGYAVRWQAQTAGDPLTVHVNDGAGAGVDTFVNIGDITGAWHHIVVVFDRDVGFKVYLDGTPLTGASDSALTGETGNIQNSSALYIASNLGANRFFVGALDELRLYSRALSAADVTELYAFGTASGPDITTGLLGHWTLNDAAGTTATDSAGSFPGTLTNMEAGDWVAAKIGTGLDFDGVNEYVTMGDVLDFERTAPFSIAFWYKADLADYTANICVVCKKDDLTPFAGYGISIRGGTAGDPWRFQLTNTSGSNDLAVNFPRPADLLWHHLVATYTGNSAATGVLLYIDAVSQTQTITTNALSATTVTAIPFQLAAQDGALFFDGQLDDVRVYNRVLTAADVNALYATGTAQLRRKGLVLAQ